MLGLIINSRELKHQKFLIHERTAWLAGQNWIGDAVCAPNANH